MCPAIDNTTSCEIRTIICFLHTKNMSAAEIHCELCAAYGQNVMSEETVRQWCRMFEDGQTDVHDEERSGQPSVVRDDLVQSVDQKTCERWRFTISELSCEFSQISLTVLYEIITVRLGYHKFCARQVLKILMGVHKKQRMPLALSFLEQYHKDGDEFVNHII
jgi:transposase